MKLIAMQPEFTRVIETSGPLPVLTPADLRNLADAAAVLGGGYTAGIVLEWDETEEALGVWIIEDGDDYAEGDGETGQEEEAS
jgi:hypothetical protein